MNMHHNRRRNSSPWQEIITIDTTIMDFALTDDGSGGGLEQPALYALVDRYSGRIVKYSAGFGEPRPSSLR